jgi:NAD(P)H-hydrate epimerase
MKVLSINQVREADAYTIANEPIDSIDLMERASCAFVHWYVSRFHSDQEVWIFCGTGNNGGDGLAIARILHTKRYTVKVFVVNPQKNRSKDFEINYQRLLPLIKINDIKKLSDIQLVPDHVNAIDALFGAGLNRPVAGRYAEVIGAINRSSCQTIAVDIPSGIFADQLSIGDHLVIADYTVAFQVAKLAFMMKESTLYIGEWFVVDIGLDRSFIDRCESDYVVGTQYQMKSLLSARDQYGHKGTYGRALLVAGSYGKMGAAVLACRAAMRSGLGLLTIHTPSCGVDILQTSIPEAMISVDPTEFYFGEVPDTSNYTSIGIGPGLDQKEKSIKALEELLRPLTKPVVIDADAINIIADHRALLSLVPEGSIITPHHREFERLVGQWKDDFERLALQKEFSKMHKVIVVFKGPYTSVSTPDQQVYFNNTGNPGMATAGSGDALTGLITGLLAQQYGPEIAARLGVFLHGLAGDLAAKAKGETSMIASDIIDMIPGAFQSLD